MEMEDLQGRFLPSRVFTRWKWPVRFGLWIVPLVLFLAGALQLYLSPNRYRSTTVFEILNGPSLRETEELLRSEGVLNRVAGTLELPNRLEIDRDTCVTVIQENLETEILKDTRMIRLEVTLIRNTDARDVADETPRALVQYLADNMRRRSEEKIAEILRLTSVEIDRAKELSIQWIKLEEVHGGKPTDPGAVTAIERARQSTLRAEAEVERLNALRQAEQTSLIERLPRLVVHTAPRIGSTPESPKDGEGLGWIVLESLGWALGFTLLLPYLLELAFPPATKRSMAPTPAFDL